MAARNTAGAPADTALNPIEVRLTGGMLALNRFLMTLQNKRMPVASFTATRTWRIERSCVGSVRKNSSAVTC